MRPPTPNLSSILSAAYIRDPSLSPTRIESPIDTLAQYLNIPDHQEDTTIISEDSELTPTMQYASLPPTTVSSYSPLLQHQREQQLQALQQQQCIPGLSQIYSPLAAASLSAASYGVVPSSVLSQEPVRSPSLSRDDSDIADDDYVPSASLITRKRPSVASQKAAAAAEEDDEEEESSSAPPPPKRQRAAPSGPISTKDWVPPDVTGLNKREARLVKNRAAAFLSRQRKREEFEQMEIRVKELEAENARLRQSPASAAQSPAPSFNPQSPAFSSAVAAATPQFQTLLAQLAEAQKREDALAAQLRDAQASLAEQQQRQSRMRSSSSASSTSSGSTGRPHQPVISHWPTVPARNSPPAAPATITVKPEEEAMDEDMPSLPTPAAAKAATSSSSSDSDSDSSDGEASVRKPLSRRRDILSRGEGKGPGSGSMALMVLLFSLSLLSGKGGRGGAATGAPAGADGARGASGAGAGGDPSQFSFSLPAPGATPAFDFRLQQQQKKREEILAAATTAASTSEDQLAATKRWATSTSTAAVPGTSSSLDSLDDEFGYFDRQVDLGMGMDFGLLGGGLVDDMGMGMGMGMNMDMSSFGMDSFAYPALSSFGSPYALPAPSAAVTRHRSGSPAASITSSGSTVPGNALFNRQLEVSVAESDADGVSFDLKVAAPVADDGSVVDAAAGSEAEVSEKKITVRVRKVDASSLSSSASVDSSALSSSDASEKKTIILELTSSSSSGEGDASSLDSFAELDALNADFEALLGGKGLAGLGMGLEGAEEMQGQGQWRLALAPRDA